MAAKGKSFAEKVSRWGVTVSNLKEHLPEMPHVADDLAALERMLGQARDLEGQQEDLRGQARELNAQLRELTKQGEKVRSRLGASLQGKFGFTSEALVKFGFKPRPQTVRRKKSTPDEPPTAAAGQTGSKTGGGAA